MDRKQHWERVYAEKSPLEVSWYQSEPTLSLELIEATRLGKRAAIIDVGGGASVLVDRLLFAGYHDISVLDLSAQALTHAQTRLGERGALVQWIEADITAFTPTRHYEIWHDRAVFHFLTDAADRTKYLAALKRAIKPQGHVIIAAFAIGGPTRCSNLDIVQYDAAKLRTTLGDEFQLLEERSELHITPAAKEQKFGYFRFQRVAR